MPPKPPAKPAPRPSSDDPLAQLSRRQSRQETARLVKPVTAATQSRSILLAAKSRVEVPSIIMMIIGGLANLLHIVLVFVILRQAKYLPGRADDAATLALFLHALNAALLLMSLTIFFGGLWMRKLRNHTLTILATVLVMFPVYSIPPFTLAGFNIIPFGLYGLLFFTGIWLLLSTLHPAVRAGFAVPLDVRQ